MKRCTNRCTNRKFSATAVLVALAMAALILTAGCTSTANPPNPLGSAGVASDSQGTDTASAASLIAEPVSPDTIKATWVSTGKVNKFDGNGYSIEYSFVGDGRGILIFYENGDKYLFEEPFGWEYLGADNATNAQRYKIEYFSKLNGITEELTLLPDGKTLTDSSGFRYAMSKLSQAFAKEF